MIEVRRPGDMVGVNRIRLGILHNAICGYLDLHFASFRHEGLDHGKSLLHRRADFILKIIIKMCSRNTNAKRPRPLAENGNIIAYRNVGAVRVERIVSRDRLQYGSRIADGRSQRPHVIQRPGKRNHAARGNAPISRLDPDTTAQRRRFANGAGRIGPNCCEAKSRSNCCR